MLLYGFHLCEFKFFAFFEQKDFDVRELREFNRQIMTQIADVIQKHPDINEAVNMYFSQVQTLSACNIEPGYTCWK